MLRPAVDGAIAALLTAKGHEEFVGAVRALDRLLVSGFYIIPFYDAGGQWVARWNTIGRPEKQPLPGFEATTLVAQSMKAIEIDVVSDVICPWCFLGKRRLDKAIGLLDDIKVEVNWRPFFLDPTIPKEGMSRRDLYGKQVWG